MRPPAHLQPGAISVAPAVYFGFVAPARVARAQSGHPEKSGRTQPILTAMVGFYLAFGVLDLQPIRLPGLAGLLTEEDLAVLDLPRGGLRIGAVQAKWYRDAVDLLRTHATSGVIYAGPDAPEIYFLAQLRNPTPAIFDFLVPDTLFHQHLVENLDRNGISAVALKPALFLRAVGT